MSGISRATDPSGGASPFALGLLLRRAHWHAATVLSEALRPLDIELRHFAVLIVLMDRGPTRQQDLVAATGSDKAGIMRVVDDLERKGLAARRSVPGDRRVREVEITPQGIEIFDAAHVAAEPLAEQLVAALRPGEPEQLTDLLARLTGPQTGTVSGSPCWKLLRPRGTHSAAQPDSADVQAG